MEVFFAGEFGEGDEGGVADVGEDVLGDAEGGVGKKWVVDSRVGGAGRGGEVVGGHCLDGGGVRRLNIFGEVFLSAADHLTGAVR